jgi:hypothetical protein
MKKLNVVLLILIFLISFGFRTIYSLQTNTFSSSNSYFVMRQIDEIEKTGLPFSIDELSYGGRTHFFQHTFFLIMGYLVKFFGKIFGLYIFPNLISSLMVFIIYLITSEITEKTSVKMISALLAGIMPFFINLTLNTLNIHFLLLPLLFLTLYFFIDCTKSKKKLIHLTISSILLTLIHPFSLFFIFIIWIYVLLMKIEDKPIKNYIIEFNTFILFFWYVTNFFFLRKGIFSAGLNLFSPGIPLSLFSKYLNTFSLFRSLTGAGILVVLLGIHGAYRSLIRGDKVRTNNVLLSILIMIICLTLLRIISISESLAYFGFIVIIFAAYSLNLMIDYSKKLKSKNLADILIYVVFILVIISTLASSVFEANLQLKEQINPDTIRALKWLETKPDNQTVLGSLEEGNLIAHYSNKPNVIDSWYHFGMDTKERIDDINLIYETPFTTVALKSLDKYNVNYILVTGEEIKIASDTTCFPKIYDDGVKIYEVKCKIN